MDIQLYDSYFVLPWYTFLPVLLTFVLIGLLLAMKRVGVTRLFFITLCVAVGLLISLSQWVSVATTIVSTLTASLAGQPDQNGLNGLLPTLFNYQLLISGIILLLSWRMFNRDRNTQQ